MKALSIKQPWASLIAHGIKNIENRTWKTNYRGRIYIHSSAKDGGSLYELLDDDQLKRMNEHWTSEYLPNRPLGAIIGEVVIVDCVINHPSIWAEQTDKFLMDIGEVKPIYNWVLSDPVLYDKPILNVKGKLSLWEFKPEKAIKFRFHRGSLEEAMKTQVEVNSKQGLIDLINKSYAPFAVISEIKFESVGTDERNGWDTYHVLAEINGAFVVVGMSDGTIN